MRRRAFTLIELLIVVALIGIFAGGTISIITAPAEEQHRATIDMQGEAGMGLFFSTVVADMHDATTVTVSAESPGLLLSGLSGGKGAARYWVDDRKQLRRATYSQSELPGTGASTEPARGAALLEGVESLEATPLPAGGLWRVRVKARQSRFGQDFVLDRQLDVMPGRAWGGEGR